MSLSKKQKPLPSQEYLLECLDYDPDTGIFIWKKRPLHHFKAEQDMGSFSTRFAGTQAGSVDHYGYVVIAINGSSYKAQRLAWKIVKGSDPLNLIDHEDTIKSNNRFNNLREATVSQNGQNKMICANNSSGFKGVTWCARGKKWRAMIRSGGEMRVLVRFCAQEKRMQPIVQPLQGITVNLRGSHNMEDTAKNLHGAAKITDTELSIVANEIRSREAQINAMIGKTLNLVCLIGADLNSVKSLLHKGEFLLWVESNCSLSQKQVNRYMRLARECPEYLDPDKCPVNLSINAALELINAPDDVQELVKDVAQTEIVHHKTIRELCGKTAYPDTRTNSMRTIEPFKPGNITHLRAIETAPRPETWQLTQHACVNCMGRLLVRRVSPKITEYICAECENRVRADEPPCWCHKEVGDPKAGGFDGNVMPTRKQEKIFECIKNPDRTAATNTIVVREKPYTPPDRAGLKSKPAYDPESMHVY